MDLFLVLLGITPGLVGHHALAEPCRRRVCIFDVRSMYNRLKPEAVIAPEDLNPTLCTHIIYGYALLHEHTIVPEFPTDNNNGSIQGTYEKVVNLKKINPNLKVILSLGGWHQKINEISSLFNHPKFMDDFVKTTIEFLKSRNFDGLDMMWWLKEKTRPDIKVKLSKTIQYLRQGFNKDATGLILTATVYGPLLDVDNVYELHKVIDDLDWINILAQDLTKYAPGLTAHHSALYPGKDNSSPYLRLNLASLAYHWMLKGIPGEKLVLGVPFFGRGEILTTDNENPGAPQKEAPKGKYVNVKYGYRPYFEICEMIKDGAKVHLMEEQGVPYLVYGKLWVSYDDTNSVREKVGFIQTNGFGGFVVYPVADDDFNGKFCGEGPFPLLRAMNDECAQ